VVACLPSDFPKWRTVHHYFSQWRGPTQTGTQCQDLFLHADAQSVKNTDCTRHKGDDASKKVSGIKRHIFVDSQWLPHAIAVTTANVTDRQGALAAIKQHPEQLSKVTSVLVDGGYTGKPFADEIQPVWGATVQVAKRNKLHTFSVIPQRWVVERSFAWQRNAGDFGKILNICLTPVCNSSTWLFSTVATEMLNRF